MAKKFLEQLADAYEEDLLTDLIPTRKDLPSRKKSPPSPKGDAKLIEKKRKSGSSSRRKKMFVGRIGEALGESQDPSQLDLFKREKKIIKKMEEAFEDNTFDQLFPKAEIRKKKGILNEDAVRFSTMISSRVLDRAKEIALERGIRIKDVINIALQKYIEEEIN